MRLLLAEDERSLSKAVSALLTKNNYSVDAVYDGQEALDYLRVGDYDGIILDIMMPKLDGVSTCLKIKETPGLENVIVVFLTARAEEYSEVAGFEAGADDYIYKPIKPRVLKSRIKALLRRKDFEPGRVGGRAKIIRIHDLEIIMDEYVVKKNGERIPLPRKEFELFSYLAGRPGKVFSREDLLARIWDNLHVTDRTVDVHVRKLREKIGSRYIVTIKGVGYKFLPV